MLSLTELKGWFEDLSKIIIDLNIALYNFKDLTAISDDWHIENIKTHGFFRHHRYQLQFIMVVQLSKIYSDNKQQKRRIKELLRRLIVEQFDQAIYYQVEDNKSIPTFNFNLEIIPKVYTNIEDIKGESKLFLKRIKTHKREIKQIEDARNQIYAHTDPGNNVTNQFIEIVYFENLIKLANDFINIFHGRLFGTDTSFEPDDWKVNDILNKFALKVDRE